MSVVKDSVGSTFNRGDFTDGLAFLWSSLDLSPYAGALGRTPHKVILVDSAGKRALGYLAGVGAGETLGSELFLNPGFDSDTNWEKDSGWTIGGGVASDNGSSGYLIQGVAPAPGVLSRLSMNITILNAGGIYLIDSGGFTYFLGLYNTTGIKTGYLTKNDTNPNAGLFGSSFNGSVDDGSLKRVTDPPNTGIHIVSSLNGTVRNWADKDTGFDPNTITTWSIENIAQVGSGSGLKRRRLVEFIPDGQNVRKRRALLEPTKEEYDWLLTKKNPDKMTQSEFEKWRRQNPRT